MDSRRRVELVAMALTAAVSLQIAAPAQPQPPGTPPQPPIQDSRQSIDDERLLTAIERELFAAKAVPASSILVSVDEGIVTLTGRVGDLLAKERAVHLATMLKGVRAVVDRLEVRPNGVDDETLRSRVVSALATDPATDSWEIRVSSENGSVRLEGTVQSWAERELAGRVARDVHGVRGVDNAISVFHPTPRADTEIERDVEQRLVWDAGIGDAHIDVQVQDGGVTLSGTVGSEAERRRAISGARVAGATSVTADGLEVRWWARDERRAANRRDVSDEQVREAVMAAMLHDPRVRSLPPAVRVDDGVVTLSGRVDSLKARRAAAQDARNTLGVRRVINHLRVDASTSPLSDEDVASNARAALERDSVLHDDAIEVWVDDDGVARLEGELSSYYAREHAADVVARVQGVTEIENLIDVGYVVPPQSFTYHDWDPVLYDFDFDYRTIRSRPDWEIQSDIESELWWSPFVEAGDVTVTVRDGVATLTGTVDSWGERMSATENALEGGAVKVINDLHIADPDGES